MVRHVKILLLRFCSSVVIEGYFRLRNLLSVIHQLGTVLYRHLWVWYPDSFNIIQNLLCLTLAIGIKNSSFECIRILKFWKLFEFSNDAIVKVDIKYLVFSFIHTILDDGFNHDIDWGHFNSVFFSVELHVVNFEPVFEEDVCISNIVMLEGLHHLLFLSHDILCEFFNQFFPR